MSSFRSNDYHFENEIENGKGFEMIDKRIEALILSKYLTEDYQAYLSEIMNTIYLDDEDFISTLEEKAWAMRKDADQLVQDITESIVKPDIKQELPNVVLKNNDVEFGRQKVRWGQANSAYKFVDAIEVLKVNEKSVKVNLIDKENDFSTEKNINMYNFRTIVEDFTA